MSLRWTEEELNAYLARKNRPAVSASHLESNPGVGSEKAHESKKIHTRVRINVHSKRKRLTDSGNVADKWAIDGLREGGLLVDDSRKYVEAITESQEQSRVEETILEIYEVKP